MQDDKWTKGLIFGGKKNMKNKREIRNNFIKNNNSSTKLLSIGIVVLMMLTALPIYVAHISRTPLSQIKTSSVLSTDRFENLTTAGLSCCVDNDGDHHYAINPNCPGSDDCNDNDRTIYPGAPELCDGKDNDCDGLIDEGLSTDHDGDGHYTLDSCASPHDDCNDNDASIHPGASEICDGKDNNCNGLIDEGFDVDHDGFTTCQGDCNDHDATIYPGAPELCDGKDNNCNGLIDEGCSCGCVDNDHDGYYTYDPINCPTGNDCDDYNPAVHPGAPELCDGIDNNCDGVIDEGCNSGSDGSKEAPTTILFYPKGGETLKGTVTVQWYVHDSQDEHWSDLPIYLYLLDNSNNWTQIYQGYKGPQYDHIFLGNITWDTTSSPDGTYRLLLEAVDNDQNVGYSLSDYFVIRNYEASPTNDPPNQPSRPYGSTGGYAGVEFTYTSSTIDPDGDQIWFMFDWGDSTNSGWLGPYTSGDTCEAKHTWQEKNNYNIIVKAKDDSGKESSWSDPLPITIRYSFNTLILQFLKLLFQRFPNAFPILR